MKNGLKDASNMKHWPFFLDQLKAWYHPGHRKLPWKDIDNAYLVWVSEVFLQQTQADRVVEFFMRFTAKFPTVEKLAKANFEEALPYFKGLGYYRRLRMMIETAKVVAKQHAGKFPNDVEALESLPGIGEYTARAIASFAFKNKVIAPDTNVKRILERFLVKFDLEAIDQHYPHDFNLNQVLMDFGSQVCLSRAPKCGECPLAKKCEFAKNPKLFLKESRKNKKGISPLRSKWKKGYQKVVVGILIQDKRVLVSRRKTDQSYSGLLEFPGGKVEIGEDERKAMQREFREEVGVEVSVRPPFEKIIQAEKKQVLSFHRCRILIDRPGVLPLSTLGNGLSTLGEEGQEVFWLDQDKLNAKEFLPANKGIIEQLKKSRL